MGRGLSPLQRTILGLAHANAVREGRLTDGARAPSAGADLYLWEVLEAAYGFGAGAYADLTGRPRYETHLSPSTGKLYRRGLDAEYRRPVGGQLFSKAAIGEARYSAAHAAVTRALRRLELRGLVVRLQGSISHWAGCELTEAGASVAAGLSVQQTPPAPL